MNPLLTAAVLAARILQPPPRHLSSRFTHIDKLKAERRCWTGDGIAPQETRQQRRAKERKDHAQ